LDNNEQILTDYMRRHYSDEALAHLLAHAEDGRLAFHSCTCFIGVPPAVAASSALHGECVMWGCRALFASEARRDIPEADAAEDAFFDLGQYDHDRRNNLIPLIKAEMARREFLRSESPELTEVTV